ncbi:MAG: DUF302 domain-containing protein [Paracoccus sp. (in: a-proteobacteria)]|nr:DUF302 domain-containing protein [Paracoccus sp. (in: a-proteobacteria)]
MQPIPKLLFSAALAFTIPLAALAEPTVYETDEPYEDAVFAVREAIIGKGLVIDDESHVGDMLDRTKEDVGGEKDLYAGAISFGFCSATVSRQVMEADIANVQYCPYNIFVYEAVENPGTVHVGFRDYPGESMAPVRELLDDIVRSALMLD